MRRFTHDAGFLLSKLAPERTGAAGAVIWIAAGEFATDDAHLGPRIMVVVGKGSSLRDLAAAGIAVTLSTPARVVGTLPEAISERTLTFAEVNRDVLLEYWRGAIDTGSALERLKGVRSS